MLTCKRKSHVFMCREFLKGVAENSDSQINQPKTLSEGAVTPPPPTAGYSSEVIHCLSTSASKTHDNPGAISNSPI